MDSPSHGSVTHWLDGVRSGESIAAQELWNRYFSRLVALAGVKLRGVSRESTEEDVALSALKSVLLGLQDNRFPDLDDRTGLWPLLVTITARKSQDELRRQFAAKRSLAAEEQVPDLQALVGHEPSSEFAVEVADELDHLVRQLNDRTLGTIAQRKLEGLTNVEIAAELGVSIRTVIRKLNRIRQEWEEGDNASTESSRQNKNA